MKKQKSFNKKKVVDWKFIVLLISIVMVGLSIWGLNQKLIYKSSAALIEDDGTTNNFKPLTTEELNDIKEYKEASDIKSNNYNKGVYHLNNGGFCTKDYCYTQDGKRTKMDKYVKVRKEKFEWNSNN